MRLKDYVFWGLMSCSMVGCSSCTSLEGLLEKYYGKAYYEVIKNDSRLVFGNSLSTEETSKIMKMVNEEMIKKTEDKKY
jgi:hypothetical protein